MAEAIGTVASILQLVDLVLRAREYLKDFHDAPKEQQKLFSELQCLQLLFAELLKRLKANPSGEALQQILGPLTTIQTTMTDLTKKLGPREPGRMLNFTARLTWTLWNKKKTAGYLEELERIKVLINVWLTMSIWDLSQIHISSHDEILKSINKATREQKDHISAEKRNTILDWLSPLNFLQRQVDIFSALQPGTGEWLLVNTQFQEWKTGSGKYLWCRGMPGAGKTVLASLVVNYLEVEAQNDNIGLACIYLNHKETEIQSLPNLLGALWKQLVLRKSIPATMHGLYDYHQERRTRPNLKEFCKALESAISQYLKVYFIIDALDEYSEHARHLFLEYLGTLGPQVHIMMTSRPHLDLGTVFPGLQILDIQATEEDLYRYLAMQIKNSPRLSKHIQTHPELVDEIQSKIVGNCKGMFLLAKLHIESLMVKNTIKAVREALQHLPKDLQDTYNEAIERINHQSEEDCKLGLLALTWVANTKRLLSVTELQEALAIEPDSTSLDTDNILDINIILAVCAGLIIVDETISLVRLVHYTTQDYLDSIQLDRFPMAHTKILSACLTFLSFEEFVTLPGSRNAYTQLVHKHPFLEYAKYCLMHAEGQPEVHLQRSIISFLSNCGRWKEVWTDVAPWNWRFRATYGSSPVWISAACNLHRIAEHLLAEGADAETRDMALHAASYYGHDGMVHLLIAHGADVNAQGGYYGTALQAGCRTGQEKVVQVLLENGANVNAQGGRLGSALQAASFGGQKVLVQLLIDNGADINIQGGFFGNALQAASFAEHEGLVYLLIDNGADVNTQGGQFGNALQAASYKGIEQVVQLLIEKGVDVNAKGGQYSNALHAASSGGHEPVVHLLLENGADVNAQGGYYGNALQAASYKGHTPVVHLLIQKGVDVNAQGKEYGHALQAASYNGHEPVVLLLIENGADVNAQGGEYGNALQAAAHNGSQWVVQLLLDNGANVNAVGGEYETALQAALAMDYSAVVQILTEHGADSTFLPDL
ncbi:ankyrin repeat domain-containing protein [Mycena pura]|uniref:Ankyrin repeat domain-containing protein n=1 Tax=Mycena pura TaxID=153505 RepID=A0AAD6YKZ8_9AGAR|nr:ankyrin repeat domain-containing protein [Mycena pura]